MRGLEWRDRAQLPNGDGSLIPGATARNRGSSDPRFRYSRALLLGLLGSLLVFLLPAIGQAHEGGTLGIEIPVERIAPGDELPIIGADWAVGAPLEVWLQPAGQARIRLGSVMTGADGHFLTAVRIPESAPSGPAAIEVVSTYGVRDTGVVTIDPTAPRPSSMPGATDAGPSADNVDPFPLIALGAALAALILLAFKTRRPKLAA